MKTEIPKVLTPAQKRLIRSEYGPIPERFRIDLTVKPLRDNPYARQTKAFVERELAELRRVGEAAYSLNLPQVDNDRLP